MDGGPITDACIVHVNMHWVFRLKTGICLLRSKQNQFPPLSWDFWHFFMSISQAGAEGDSWEDHPNNRSGTWSPGWRPPSGRRGPPETPPFSTLVSIRHTYRVQMRVHTSHHTWRMDFPRLASDFIIKWSLLITDTIALKCSHVEPRDAVANEVSAAPLASPTGTFSCVHVISQSY